MILPQAIFGAELLSFFIIYLFTGDYFLVDPHPFNEPFSRSTPPFRQKPSTPDFSEMMISRLNFENHCYSTPVTYLSCVLCIIRILRKRIANGPKGHRLRTRELSVNASLCKKTAFAGTTSSAGQASLDRRVVKTQKALRAAFHRLVITEGPQKITVSALAREADIDRKTFYLHFDSIEDLIDAESTVVANELLADINALERTDGTSMVTALIIAFENVFGREREYYQALLSSLSIDRIVDLLTPTFLNYYALHTNQPGEYDPVATEYLVRFFLAGSLSIFRHWFAHEPETSIKQMQERIENIIANTPLLGALGL